MDLRQSTNSQVITIGQALDSTDGDTEENALTIANTDIKIHKHNTTVLADKNSGGATNISNGVFYLTLNATDTSVAGRLVVYIHVAGALSMKAEFNVLTATAFDALYAGTFNNLGGTAQTEDHTAAIAAISTVVPPSVSQFDARTIVAAAYFDPAADTVANVTLVATTTTNTDMRGTEAAALATALTTIDGIVDAILVDTTEIGVAGAGLTSINLPNQIMDITGNLSGSVGSVTTDVGITQAAADKSWSTAIRVLTANTNLNDVSAAQVNTQCDLAISDALLATAANLATVDINIDAILVDTATTIPNQITALNNIAAADVWVVGVRTLTAFTFGVDVDKVNGATVLGNGTGANLWRG